MSKWFRSLSASAMLCSTLAACGTDDPRKTGVSGHLTAVQTDRPTEAQSDRSAEILSAYSHLDRWRKGVIWEDLDYSDASYFRKVATRHRWGEYVSTDFASYVAVGPSEKIIVTGSDRARWVRLWDVKSGRELATLQGHEHYITSVAFSPDGTTVATGSKGGATRLWDAKSGRELRNLVGYDGDITSVAFSPNGKLVATGSEQRIVRTWDVSSGRNMMTIKAGLLSRDSVTSVAFSPDGETVATGLSGSGARVWDVGSGRHLKTFAGHDGGINSVAFSPDGKIIATGSDDHTIRLWDVRSGRVVKTLAQHRSKVTSVAFSPDGTVLATGSNDETVRLWEVSTGSPLAVLKAQKGMVTSVAFSSNGQLLFAADGSSPTVVWLVTEIIARIRREQAMTAQRDIPPAERITSYVNENMAAWLEERLPIVEAPPLPKSPQSPTLPKLVKGEFETVPAFKVRVAKEQQAYNAHVERISAKYRADLSAYNRDVERYNQELPHARAARRSAIPAKRNQLLSEAMVLVYGKPLLDDLTYNTDTRRFSGVLRSSNGKFSESIVMGVPLEYAESVKTNIGRIRPVVNVNVNDGQLTVTNVGLSHGGKNYSARVSAVASNRPPISVQLAHYTPRDLGVIPVLRPVRTVAAVKGSDDFFAEALAFENDLDIARERQRLAAAQQKQHLAEEQRKKAAYLARLRARTASVEQSLRSTSPADPRLARAVSEIHPAHPDTRKYLFALAIEDYRFAPDVPNADNSLGVVIEALSKRLGIPSENQTVVSGEDATAGFVRSELADLLSRLKPQDSLYFYYSGHSIPGTINRDKLYLAPKDTQIKHYEDPNFAMDTILRQFENSDVGAVYGFLDTCFSGKSSHDAYIFGGIGAVTTGRREKLPSKVTMFYAAQGDQYANDLPERGHRLFSYYLAEGLAKGHTSTKALGSYIRKRVEDISRRRGRTFAQTPYVKGPHVNLR